MAALQLNTGEYWEPDNEQVTKWIGLYPAVNVPGELNAMTGWLDANPKKRKTKRGIATFCNSWLSRAQDKGGSGMAKPKNVNGSIKTRDMSMTDDLSHNFIDSPDIAAHFQEKFGQVFHG